MVKDWFGSIRTTSSRIELVPKSMKATVCGAAISLILSCVGMSLSAASAPVSDQPVLRAERLLARRRLYALVAAVRQQAARLFGIPQVHLEDVPQDRIPNRLRFDRKKYLNAAVEVPGHQVGAAEEHLFVAAITEVIDTRVLKKSPNDRCHRDRLAKARD